MKKRKLFTLLSSTLLTTELLVATAPQIVSADTINNGEASNSTKNTETTINNNDDYNPLLRSTYHTLGPEYYGKKKVKWYVVDSNTGSNGIVMESNTGKFKYIVTRDTWQTVGHVMYHGWVSGMQDGYGFGHR